MKVWLKGLSKRKNTTAFFRLKIKKSVGKYRLRLAGAGVFRLMVGDCLVGYGPRRTKNGFGTINEYDISKFVHKGDVWITVEIAYYGNDSFYIIDEQPFFWCEIYKDGSLFKQTDDFEAYCNSTRVQKVLRYSWQRNFLETYHLERDPFLRYDGEIDAAPCEIEEVVGNELTEVDLPYPTFARQQFKQIESGGVEMREKGATPYAMTKSSNKDSFSFFFPDDELESDAVKEYSRFYLDRESKSRDRFTTWELSENKTGFIYVDLTVDHDSEVWFTFDEVINEEKLLHHSVPQEIAERDLQECYRNGTYPLHFARVSTCNLLKYSLKKGRYRLLSFEPYTMKYLRILTVGASVKIDELSLIAYENPDVLAYSYKSDDEVKNAVFRAAQNTLSQNSVDLLTDCPSRERTGWLCDSFFSSRAEFILTGKNRVEKNGLDCFLSDAGRSDIPSCMPPMCFPNDHKNGKFIPNWGMFLYLELEEYVARNNDFAFAERFKEKAYALLSYFESFENEYGFLEDLDGWIFVEWSKSNDYTNGVNFPTNMLYSAYLKALGRLYSDEKLIVKGNEIAQKINQWAIKDDFYVDNAVRANGVLTKTNHISETCQYYAFYFGIATKEANEKLYRIIFEEFSNEQKRNQEYRFVDSSNMFIGDVLRLDYLHKIGKHKQVISECLRLFGKMATRSGSLWEYETPLGSCCHAFASVCVDWLLADQK